MANGYMPRRDSEALHWLKQFAGGLVERPGVYYVSPEEAAGLHDAVMRFDEAFRVATSPHSRTQMTVMAKDTARTEAEMACRPFYARVKSDLRISDQDKMAISVKPINAARSPIKAPQTAPWLMLKDKPCDTHTLLYSDSGPCEGIAKPAGAVQLQLFRAIAEEQTDQLSYYGSYSRGPIKIDLHVSDHGKLATYRARWITRRGETGPWGPPLCVPIFATSMRFGQRDRDADAAPIAA